MAAADKPRIGRPPRAGEAAGAWISFRVTTAEQTAIDAARGEEGRNAWCRRAALESAHVATSGRGGKVRR